MKKIKETAIKLLKQFKSDDYIFGNNCLSQLPKLIDPDIKGISVVIQGFHEKWMKPSTEQILKILDEHNILIEGKIIMGAEPNAPRDDVFRIADELKEQGAELVITIGSGSGIDATKAAVAYWILSDHFPELDDYFGMGSVTKILEQTKRKLPQILAVQWASSSAAHLTKYSNITDIDKGQKMLIVDEALVPAKALFDYSVTVTQPETLTLDGGLDGISHCLEVYMGIDNSKLALAKEICLTGIELVVQNLREVCVNPENQEAREAIGLATDLGGYAIMVGGTNGAHLNSFSMTDILSHGRACALMNPYYVVFFSPAIDDRLMDIAAIYHKHGYLKEEYTNLSGRHLGLALARAMVNMSKEIGFPTSLQEVPGFSTHHIEMCLEAAKNQKLESKLKNMPVPLNASLIDQYMGPILQAARTGDFSLIKNV